MRAIEFDATEEGDWALHCHKAHHTMNAMGHDLPTMIGVDQSKVLNKITRLVPDYMAMGEHGWIDGGDGDALAGQHPAHDDRARPVRPRRDGRHVQHREGPAQPGAG
jgi:hypothetical protein